MYVCFTGALPWGFPSHQPDRNTTIFQHGLWALRHVMGMGPKLQQFDDWRSTKSTIYINLPLGNFDPNPNPYVSHVRSKKPLPCNEALPVLQSVPENDTTPTIRDRALKKGMGSIGFSSFMIFPISYGQYMSAWWLFSIVGMKTPTAYTVYQYISLSYIMFHPLPSNNSIPHRHIATSHNCASTITSSPGRNLDIRGIQEESNPLPRAGASGISPFRKTVSHVNGHHWHHFLDLFWWLNMVK
jgi:hypothetical protein